MHHHHYQLLSLHHVNMNLIIHDEILPMHHILFHYQQYDVNLSINLIFKQMNGFLESIVVVLYIINHIA